MNSFLNKKLLNCNYLLFFFCSILAKCLKRTYLPCAFIFAKRVTRTKYCKTLLQFVHQSRNVTGNSSQQCQYKLERGRRVQEVVCLEQKPVNLFNNTLFKVSLLFTCFTSVYLTKQFFFQFFPNTASNNSM